MNDPPSKRGASGHQRANVHPSDSEHSVDRRKIVSFEDLAGGKKTVFIDFHGQQYRLRLTKSGRLVLTK